MKSMTLIKGRLVVNVGTETNTQCLVETHTQCLVSQNQCHS
jgi:hypothetical protein